MKEAKNSRWNENVESEEFQSAARSRPLASLGRKQLLGERFKAERLGVRIKSKDEESCGGSRA